MAADSTTSSGGLTTDGALDRTSGLRLLRLVSVFVSVGYVAYGLVAVPVIVDSMHVMAMWWTVPALIAVFVPGMALGALGWRAKSPRRLQLLARLAVSGFALTMATWWFGWSGDIVNETTGIWFSMFFGVAGLASTLAFRAPSVFGTLTVFALGSTVINHAIRPPELNQSLVPDAAWAGGFSLVFVAAGTMVVATAQLMDRTREAAYAASARIATTTARTTERARFDALTHDNVMATLLMASRHGASNALAGHARSALLAIDAAASDDRTESICGQEAIARILGAVLSSAPSATISHKNTKNSSYPATVVSDLSAAAAEAARNSTLHAGPDATVTVTVDAGADQLSVAVADDGIGFDPDVVPPTRFGVAVSIRGRMTRLAGGSSSVTSSSGAGTRVELKWQR